MQFDEAANESEVQVNVAQQLEVVLQETPTTGYRWKVVSDGAPVTRIERDEFVPPAGATPGAPGRHTWVFAAARTGTAQIELAYARSFGGGEPARRFTVRVVVR